MLRRTAFLITLALTIGVAQAQERLSDQIYMKSGGAAFTLDVFKVAKPNSPAVIWVVSGGWFSKHEDLNTDLAKLFNAKGITLVEVVHGSQPKYTLTEIVPMIRRAVRYVHANATRFGIDPNRIGISGGSAGGHLSLMVAGLEDGGNPSAKDPVDQASSSVNGVGILFPPTDFLNFGKPNYTPFDNPLMAIFMPAFGVTPQTPHDEDLKIGREFSPIYLVTKSFPPTFVVHGDADQLVPLTQSQALMEALEKAGVDHQLVVIPGGGHDMKTILPGLPKIVDWFAKLFGVAS